MIGTVGFVPERLREAREARGLTAVALAELLGITPMAISQYENGKHSPRPELMEKLAATLNLPLVFFKRPFITDDDDAIFWRSFSSATKAARARCKRRMGWFKDIVRYLSDFFDFPAVNVPIVGASEETILSIEVERIEELAMQCRELWGLGEGPISNVLLQMENNGIVVCRTRFDATTLDAFSNWDELPYVIIGSDKDSAVRGRYDAAHELGHLILHRTISMRSISSVPVHKFLEQCAFRFASAFLLPAQQFVKELWAPTLDAFRSLKDRWKVAIGMMIFRSKELGLIDDSQAKNLWINYNRRGWRKREPLDDQIEAEKPRLIRRCFETLIKQGLRTKEQILLDLPYFSADIEALAGLPSGYFDSNFGDVVTMRLKSKPTKEGRRLGTVVPFSRN